MLVLVQENLRLGLVYTTKPYTFCSYPPIEYSLLCGIDPGIVNSAACL